MKRIIYIAWKDITQVLRNPTAVLFLLVLRWCSRLLRRPVQWNRQFR
jgi:hypothetical protein